MTSIGSYARRSVWSVFLVTLVIAVATIPAASPANAQRPQPYRLLQMNLCLSGIAGCYPGTHYPAVVDEAIDQIRANEPDVATLVETCSVLLPSKTVG